MFGQIAASHTVCNPLARINRLMRSMFPPDGSRTLSQGGLGGSPTFLLEVLGSDTTGPRCVSRLPRSLIKCKEFRGGDLFCMLFEHL